MSESGLSVRQLQTLGDLFKGRAGEDIYETLVYRAGEYAVLRQLLTALAQRDTPRDWRHG